MTSLSTRLSPGTSKPAMAPTYQRSMLWSDSLTKWLLQIHRGEDRATGMAAHEHAAPQQTLLGVGERSRRYLQAVG